MNIQPSSYFSHGLLLLAAGLLLVNVATAAPGVISQEPLQTSSSAPPNLLFHLDTSGSMRHIVPEFTAPATPYSCSGTSLIAAGSTVTLNISSGNPSLTLTDKFHTDDVRQAHHRRTA